MNHRRLGSVSLLVLWAAPVLAYLTTHRLCNFHQFCPATNVEVKLPCRLQRYHFIYSGAQCSDQVTESYVQNIVLSVLLINGVIILGHLCQRYHLGRKIRRLTRQPGCRVGAVTEDTETSRPPRRHSSRTQLRLQNRIPHHVTFNSGLISILIPTFGTGSALFVLRLLNISIFE